MKLNKRAISEIWNNLSSGQKIMDLIVLVIFIVCVGWYIYLEYPDFSGSKLMWVQIKDTFTWGIILFIIGFTSFITILCFLLNNIMVKQAKEVNSLKNGDKISYGGYKGTFKSVNKIGGMDLATIEITVPLMNISKSK